MFSYSVKVFTLKNPKSKLVGFASLTIDDVLQIDGFKIFDGSQGLFVKPPSHEGTDKEGEKTWFDDVKFVEGGRSVMYKDTESRAAVCRDEIYKSIIAAYSENSNSRTNAARSQASVNEESESKNSKRPLW